MANTKLIDGFRAEFNVTGSAIRFWKGYLKSNIALSIGDALSVASGLIYRHGGVAGCLGVSAEQISSTTRNLSVLFVPAIDDIVFSAPYGSATTHYMTTAVWWTNKKIAGTKGKMYVSTGGNSICRIIGLHRNYSNSYYGHCYLIFKMSTFTGRS